MISGLIGLRPRADETVEVNPLVPGGTWDYFCLDQIRYHGRWLTILFDKTGEHYRQRQRACGSLPTARRSPHRGQDSTARGGLARLVSGQTVPQSRRVKPTLETSAGWNKFERQSGDGRQIRHLF